MADPKDTQKRSGPVLQTIGWREWVALPELGIAQLKAKVDTGARTSALHAFTVETFRHEDDTEWVRFGVHPDQRSTETELFCEAPVLDKRKVRDSGGHQEERFVIETEIVLGSERLRVELTLTARDDMLFRMLLGRTAMRRRFVVDPSRSYLLGKKKRKKKQRKSV
jgi:hypothetical protein